jgi:predicted alpha/beta superfamily hydrolase
MPTPRPPRAPLLLLALAALAAAPRPVAAAVALSEVKLPSEVFGGERVILVLEPAGAREAGRRLPVLYFADGDRLMPAMAAAMRVLVDAGVMPELLLVGIRHADRTRELTPTAGWMPTARGGRRDVPGSGGADQLLDHLEREVIPLVERTWKVEPLRLLAGHSFGGLFALHALATRPALFQGWLAISPTVHWEGDLVPRRVAAALAARAPRGSLVVTQGDEGPVAAAALTALEAALAAGPGGLAVQVHRFAGEDHGTVVLPSLSRGLRELFPGWRMEIGLDEVGPRGGLAAVERHYRALSERFGYEVPMPEALVNLAGYQALQDGQPEEALRAFQRNVADHPRSPNVHDSLGEAFERAGDLQAAAASYQRAWELAEKQGDPRLPLFKRNAVRAAAALAR